VVNGGSEQRGPHHVKGFFEVTFNRFNQKGRGLYVSLRIIGKKLNKIVFGN
jgi:hypothetical protein